MFIIRFKETDRVLFLDRSSAIVVLCRDKKAADKAVAELSDRFGQSCYVESAEETTLSGLWRLRDDREYPGNDLRHYGPTKGIHVAFRDRGAALMYAERVNAKTGRELIPELV